MIIGMSECAARAVLRAATKVDPHARAIFFLTNSSK
jgi:hypothetical protein